MNRRAATISAISEMRISAEKARRLCTDIMRQTAIKPYYGKYGAAAIYADEDESEAQSKLIADAADNITEALNHLAAANEMLVQIAVNGGSTAAQIAEITRGDYNRNKGQIANVEDCEVMPSISEKITLQK